MQNIHTLWWPPQNFVQGIHCGDKPYNSDFGKGKAWNLHSKRPQVLCELPRSLISGFILPATTNAATNRWWLLEPYHYYRVINLAFTFQFIFFKDIRPENFLGHYVFTRWRLGLNSRTSFSLRYGDNYQQDINNRTDTGNITRRKKREKLIDIR